MVLEGSSLSWQRRHGKESSWWHVHLQAGSRKREQARNRVPASTDASSSKALHPTGCRASQIVPQTEEQVLRYMSLWGIFLIQITILFEKCKRTKRGLKLDRHGDYHMKTHRGKMITFRRGLRLELLLHAKECLGSSRRLKWKWRLLSQKQLKGKAPPAFFTSIVGRQHISAFLGHPVYGAYGSI